MLCKFAETEMIISALEPKGKLQWSQSKKGIGNFAGIIVPEMLFDWITLEIWLIVNQVIVKRKWIYSS